MKTFAIGDIHGADKALVQCLERSHFDYEQDRLIVLGDVCDGYPGVKQCVDELLKIKQCDYIIGNHDVWALDWAERGERPIVWTNQGGHQTIASYDGKRMPAEHVHFLKKAHLWMVVDNKLFVHGGIDPKKKMEKQSLECLTWDRKLVESAWSKSRRTPDHKFSTYDEIFVGHTTTQRFSSTVPLFLCNVIMLDTGAGWSGKLTIMDIHSHEYWQSDLTPQLQGMAGRR